MIRVTVEDTESGDSQTALIENDYILTCAGGCYLDHTQVFANGTHILTVKGRVGNSDLSVSEVADLDRIIEVLPKTSGTRSRDIAYLTIELEDDKVAAKVRQDISVPFHAQGSTATLAVKALRQQIDAVLS